MPSTAYTTLRGATEAEIEVKRSRFLCRVERVADEAAARAVVEAARKQHWDARHHCSAFLLGPDADIQRSSDDGEPAGTAGMPILEVLRGRDLRDVVAVVTRWFSGTLLGAGGLVRAYGDATRAALESAPTVRRQLLVMAGIAVPHAEAGKLEHDLRAQGVQVLGTGYAAAATVRISIRPEDLDETSALVQRSARVRLRSRPPAASGLTSARRGGGPARR